ncbi:hypothetical protein J2797_005649 [Paraburkholderia terricola]|jgi:hypothetical protein|uniref:Uncharacterized protein n=1 Tax=Paraburkholderia terricola TaxID=169427 RepID=A0ABU1M2E5_9BURK|nr:hypothetical protein [Paraburkholderia terricola]MDR6450086.1 hypothetical protein [Paraburkholderia terricola]MDR6484865.1 hypothetical protein [Paraburkholderia terricola]MDR6495725.1 hypothetical protein [Paraburkholderia terricola]
MIRLFNEGACQRAYKFSERFARVAIVGEFDPVVDWTFTAG